MAAVRQSVPGSKRRAGARPAVPAAPAAPAVPAVPLEPPLLVPALVIDDTHEEVKRRAVALAAKLSELTVDGRLVVRDAEELQYAADLYNNLGLVVQDAERLWEPLCKAFHRFHRELCARRDAAMNLGSVPRAQVAAAINAFNREQKRLRREEEERLRREREEAQRLVDAAHAEALEVERARLRTEQEQAAADAAASGDKKLAKQILAAPTPEPVLPPPPPVVVTPAVPAAAPVRAAGIAARVTWKYRLHPEDGSGVRREYCIPDEKTIRRLVTSMGKRAEAVVGGIVVEEEYGVASTGRRA